MGLRKSKQSPKSYDIAPVVTNQEFTHRSSHSPAPQVPKVAKVATMETKKVESPDNNIQKTESSPATKTVEVVTKEKETLKSPVDISSNTPKKEPTPASPAPAQDAEKQSPPTPIPSWVTEENFKPTLSKAYPNFKEIVSFKPEAAMAAGENYATLMLRVNITIRLQDNSTQDVSYMLKVAHDNKDMKDMLDHMNFFDTENATYNDVLPELHEMYRQAGQTVEFGPRAHHLADAAPKAYYTLLEDLGVHGYKNTNRLESLDTEHVEAVLKKMAQFHAATACRIAAKGEYKKEIFSPDMSDEKSRALISQLFGSFREPFLENLPTYKNGGKYVEIMDKFFDNLIDVFVFQRTPRPGYFNVLNHGDAWSNNILFHYGEDGKLDELMFVDFQNSNYGSPSQDLFYFLISSVQVDIKVKKFDHFVQYYYQHLVQNLELLNYTQDIPSLQELRRQLWEYGCWAMVTTFMTLGIVLLDPTDNAKFENFMGTDQVGTDFKNNIYRNPRYHKHINELLPWLYENGFMDVSRCIEAEDKASSVFSYPQWVNESCFADIIRQDYADFRKVLKFVVSPATNVGDNYSSTMLKVDIDLELADKSTRSVSYMLKIPPNGDEAKALISSLNSFSKEAHAYKELLPQFTKAYEDAAGTPVHFGPRSYAINNVEEKDTLVLENLKLKGFKNCDRLQGLDMEHMKAALKILAQFHAASAFVATKQRDLFDMYKISLYTEETKKMQEAQIKEFQALYLESVQLLQGKEEYLENLENYMKYDFDTMIKVTTIDDAKFNVLNHGDCWTNNIMYKHDEQGNILETYFVDFQLMHWGSPAADLYYLIFTSAQYELKLQQFDFFIRYYHENLKASLEALKYPKHIITLKEMLIEMYESGAWAMYAALFPLAIILLDPTEGASLDKLMRSDEEAVALKKLMFQSQRYQKHAEAILPWMSRRGLMHTEPFAKAPITSDPPQLNVPSWIDAEHLAEIVRPDIKDFKEITNILVTSVTKPGDNYASSLLRVKCEVALMDGSTTTKSFVIKIPLTSEYEHAIVDQWNFFDKETLVYSKYLREFEELYAQQGEKVVLGPKYYEIKELKGKDVLILEDLAERKFKCADRRIGMDIKHAESVLEKLALFHAASARYVELHGAFPAQYNTGIYTEESRKFFETMKMDFFLDYAKTYEHNELYIEKLPQVLNSHIDHNIEISKVDASEFNVLNHGDSWLNNIMFRYEDNGQLAETQLIDFQVCQYGSPALDLWYFIISSTQLDIKVQSFDYMVRYYHEHLVKNLRLLQFSGKVPDLKDFHQTMLKYGYKGFDTFLGVMTVCLLSENQNANMANFSAETEEGKQFRDALYTNERYKANAAVVLPWLIKRGCLE